MTHNCTLYNERVTSVRWQRNQFNILFVISRHWVTMFVIIFRFNTEFEWLKYIKSGLREGLLSTSTPFERIRTCINTLNIWRSVCRTFKIGPYIWLFCLFASNKCFLFGRPNAFLFGLWVFDDTLAQPRKKTSFKIWQKHTSTPVVCSMPVVG